jgi:hypothetical protein
VGTQIVVFIELKTLGAPPLKKVIIINILTINLMALVRGVGSALIRA